MMSNLFDIALDIVLHHEGGYVNNPHDTGGETNFGISDRRDGRVDGMADVDGDGHPDVDIKSLTKQQAAEIYRREYWDKVRAEQLPSALAVVLFDTAVNAGNSRAIRLLQRTLGIKEDGVIGPATLRAANNHRNTSELVDHFCAERILFNASTQSWPTFGRGWTRRVLDVAHQAKTGIRSH